MTEQMTQEQAKRGPKSLLDPSQKDKLMQVLRNVREGTGDIPVKATLRKLVEAGLLIETVPTVENRGRGRPGIKFELTGQAKSKVTNYFKRLEKAAEMQKA